MYVNKEIIKSKHYYFLSLVHIKYGKKNSYYYCGLK